MNEAEQTTRLIALLVAGAVAGWVRLDARQRGFKTSAALAWSAGVFLVMVVFLPLYLWVRRQHPLSHDGARVSLSKAPIAAVPCPYCGYPDPGPNFCEKCGRQLKSSTEIHRS